MTGRSTRRMLSGFALIMTMVLVAASGYAFSLGKYEKVKATGGVVSIPTSAISDNKAKFYKFAAGEKEVAFFVVKGSDGSYKAAFDACDACYQSKKGYEQQGDKMNCKNCNQKFAINRLGPNATGGCNPGYLPHQLQGGKLSIKTDDLKAGARYF